MGGITCTTGLTRTSRQCGNSGTVAEELRGLSFEVLAAGRPCDAALGRADVLILPINYGSQSMAVRERCFVFQRLVNHVLLPPRLRGAAAAAYRGPGALAGAKDRFGSLGIGRGGGFEQTVVQGRQALRACLGRRVISELELPWVAGLVGRVAVVAEGMLPAIALRRTP